MLQKQFLMIEKAPGDTNIGHNVKEDNAAQILISYRVKYRCKFKKI